MGIKESYPVIRGKSVSLKTQEEKEFFNRSHLIIKNNFINNSLSDYNLLKSLEVKTFKNGIQKPEKNEIRDITWIEYLIIHINNLKNKYYSSWAIDLLNILERKNITISENKFFSEFFYHEYEIKTMPRIANCQNEKMEENPIINYDDIKYNFYNSELTNINDNNFCQLDILENLGGSYLEINYDDLLPDDPTVQYHLRRNNVKKYMKIFKEHLYDNKDHPIYQIIHLFNDLFSKYIHDKIKEYENQLEKEIINQERFETLIKNFEEEITYSLQEIISRMHSAIKLFYSTSLDYKFFEEEKDDLINMVTSLFFRIGNLYESILNLYSYSFKNEFQNFQEKLIELKSVKPKKLGIETKFCLDEDTLKLQNSLKKKKNIKNEKIKEDIDDNKENNNNEKKPKKSSLFQKISKDIKGNNLFPINEQEDEKEDININNINIIVGSQNKKDTGKLVYYLDEPDEYKNKNSNIQLDYNLPLRSKTKLSSMVKEDYYLLEKMSFLEDSKYENYYNQSNQIRYTVNNFNNKVYFFPKLYNKLKKHINLYENKKGSIFSKNKDDKGNNNYIPYLSAINLMKSIKKYKTPFEKIILIAAISDQIMESATNFWKNMESYIEKDYLFIEADEIMTIFLYIIIQSQMPEIILYCKIINNFTTQFTKGFNISYNYTLLEASLDYINGLKDIKELSKKENGFNDASRSILDISNQRISRISLGIGQG